ncbi:dimethylamine monooxygenase subunit DmmA family protein [Pseudomonas sp. G2-4]|uniref:dimethylamine monooxygenase subunit DmmA family protein n=1 Tax=Pseudomonas sp. G2-4 TaxID=1506334 RepID=UPI0024BB66F7|nr:dimethylamine monooxygenase subunit DmmA family protein [Pseudomonas sp. G2-4]WHS58398.1 dimethylamine monooxygenase subunit DmmA family protein [Pseudomonas sp. G2-4]
MTDRQSAAPDRLHSLPRYRQPLPRESVTRHIVVMQSAAACAPFVGELEQPLVLNGENADFSQRLHQVLASATVGSHLYIMGDEAFIWRIHGEARCAGLEDDEIDITRTIAGARLVYCVHCGLTQATGPAPLLACIACDVALEVREHFSRRLGAYLGVCTNPDQPYAAGRS